eukprot:1968762-Pleurochrysis_carterae.AAC.1
MAPSAAPAALVSPTAPWAIQHSTLRSIHSLVHQAQRAVRLHQALRSIRNLCCRLAPRAVRLH